jgi:hypothetical protein
MEIHRNNKMAGSGNAVAREGFRGQDSNGIALFVIAEESGGLSIVVNTRTTEGKWYGFHELGMDERGGCLRTLGCEDIGKKMVRRCLRMKFNGYNFVVS